MIIMWNIIVFAMLCNATPLVFARREKGVINFGGFVCPREEKALGRCLRDKLNVYIPQLGTGLPEYGIPACEPLFIPSIEVAQAAGPVSVMSSYSNVTVRGPSTMKVTDVQVDSKKHQLLVYLYIPELKMNGNYHISGQILMLPIDGHGHFTGTYDDINAIVKIILGRAPRANGPEALTCKELDVKFHIGKASVHLDNLFGGDNDLGNAMNNFLNQNWQKLAEELQVPLETSLRDFFKPLADHAFSTLNADDILTS